MTRKSIQVSKNLFVDQELFQFLMNVNSIIVNVLTNFDSVTGMNYLSATDSNEMISYLPMEKFKNDDDTILICNFVKH